MSSEELAIRAVEEEDFGAIRHIVAGTEMFYPDEVDTALELAMESVAKTHEGSGYFAHIALMGCNPVGYIVFGPTPLTVGTYDLYWLVVDKAVQGKGLGRKLVQFVARAVRERGGRLILAETSGRKEYEPTRAFYERTGLRKVSEIEDFYRLGDSKVTYALRV